MEIKDGGTDAAKLLGKFCNDAELSSMTSSGNYLYVHFYTDVPDPKNGFKAVVTSGGDKKKFKQYYLFIEFS